ncbi:MAG: cupin domain-containing protein [Lyngbya sp. HA4199-MV5]|nr:cupin domain-containing protein [Lyngbya sp. HA4199-MV5]
MVQTTVMHRSFHLQLLPMKAAAQQVINVEVVEYTHGQQILYQQSLMSLGADTALPELCDEKDVTIAILEGCGNLTLNQESIPLEPGRFIFIPAQMPHTLQSYTSLVFLLCRSESHAGLQDTAWAITL